MSELRPLSPVRRPQTARPRQELVPQVAPPSAEELHAIEWQLVALPGLEGASISVDPESGVAVVRGPGGGPDATYAALPRWGGQDWPATLAAIRERMHAVGAWPSLLLCDRPDHAGRAPDRERELERRGWLRVASESVMWVGHASVVPHLDPQLRIEAVQPRTLPRHEALERGIFGIGAAQAERRRAALAEALESGRLRAWIVWLGSEPVAVARLSQGEGVAGLQGIGVVEGYRGQGLGTLITTIATRAGLAVGNRIIWLSVRADNEVARRTYARLGFRSAFSWTRWLVSEAPQRR